MKTKAFSLFIALSLIGAISIVALTVSGVIVSSITRASEMQESQQAYYNSMAARELAKLELKDRNPGYESGSKDSPNTYSDGEMGEMAWYIKGLLDFKLLIQGATGSGEYYTLPIRGQGDGLDNCNGIETADFENWRHACDWYKLGTDQSVVIPLYVEKNGTIYNPSDEDNDYFNLQDIRIVFRTPCIDEESADPDCERYQIHSDLDEEILVHWTISGTCADGESCFAYSNQSSRESNDSRIKGTDINQISINSTPQFSQYTLNSTSYINTTDPETGQNIQRNLLTFLTDNYFNFKKGELQMTQVGNVYDEDLSDIPYLEYQIQIDAQGQFADRYQTIYYSGETAKFQFDGVEKEEINPNLSEFTVSL